MSFDPRLPWEIHYLEAKSGDEMVESLSTWIEMQSRAADLSVRGQAIPGSIRLYEITRLRVAISPAETKGGSS